MACISSLVIKRLFYTQKHLLIAHTRHGLPEKAEKDLLGEFTLYLFFALGLGVGVGDDQCLFNVAAGIKS